MAELCKLTALLDQLRGNYLIYSMVFLYLICSAKVVCEDREEVLGKNSKDIVLKQNFNITFICAKILHVSMSSQIEFISGLI